MATASATKQPVEARDAKKAVDSAQRYFRTLFPSVATPVVSLEEVELSSDRRYWLVTLSHEEPRPKAMQLPEFLRVPQIKFKVFRVDRRSGEVVSMKMRNGG